MIITDGKKAVSIEMYTWKDGNTSNDYAPEFFDGVDMTQVVDEDGWGVCVGNDPVYKVEHLDVLIDNARQWADTYEPTDGEEAYADIDEIEITW